MYQIFYTKKAKKNLEQINSKTQKAIKTKLETLAQDPFVPNNNLKTLQGVKNGFRLRVDRFRILFFIISKNKQIIITNVFIKKNKNDYNRNIDNLIITQKFFT